VFVLLLLGLLIFKEAWSWPGGVHGPSLLLLASLAANSSKAKAKLAATSTHTHTHTHCNMCRKFLLQGLGYTSAAGCESGLQQQGVAGAAAVSF